MLPLVHRITQLPDPFLVGQLNLRGFKSRKVATSHGTIHVLDAQGRGKLPPIVFLHGFSAAAHYYDGMMLRMRPHARRIVAPDLLGHGLSDMPKGGLDHGRLRRSLLTAFDRVITEPCIVFGNSLGGAAALKLAFERPDMIRGLFLVAPGGAPMPPEELSKLVDRFRIRTHEQALAFVDGLFAKKHPMRHVLAWGTRHQFSRPGLRDLLERATADDLFRAEDIGKLTMPIQVLWGAHDRILHPSSLEFFRGALPPHARLDVIDHYGHTPHMDHPEDLHERFVDFVKDVDAGRRRRAGSIFPRPMERHSASGASASIFP
jgi:pimeloyl-ACP methyl ester carboxylesterase